MDVWKVFSDLRGVRKGEEREKERTDNKMRSVLFSILTFIRRTNPRHLTYWAAIQSIANFGWGVGRTAADAGCYFGSTISSSTRELILAELVKDLKERQLALFVPCVALIYTYDNYQRGQQLKFQRGSHASNFIKGTHEVAHKVFQCNVT